MTFTEALEEMSKQMAKLAEIAESQQRQLNLLIKLTDQYERRISALEAKFPTGTFWSGTMDKCEQR